MHAEREQTPSQLPGREDAASTAHSNSMIELAKGHPRETVRFMQVSLLVGGICGMLVAVPSVAMVIFAQKSLGWLHLWLAIAALLHMVQVPLRFRCCHWLINGANSTRTVALSGQEDDLLHQEVVCTLVASIVQTRSWKVNQAASSASMAWLFVGALLAGSSSPTQMGCAEAWYLTVAVIVLAVARAVITIVSFRVMFCFRGTAEIAATDAPDRPCGAKPERLQTMTGMLCDELHASSSSGSGCAICLSCFVQEEALRILPCGHCFHQDCVDQWLLKTCVCPLCRSDESAWIASAPCKP